METNLPLRWLPQSPQPARHASPAAAARPRPALTDMPQKLQQGQHLQGGHHCLGMDSLQVLAQLLHCLGQRSSFADLDSTENQSTAGA